MSIKWDVWGNLIKENQLEEPQEATVIAAFFDMGPNNPIRLHLDMLVTICETTVCDPFVERILYSAETRPNLSPVEFENSNLVQKLVSS